jgi:murein L,D-transpeptidase YcbB/YkuD
MTKLSKVNRAPPQGRFRRLRLTGLALAMTSAFALAGCQQHSERVLGAHEVAIGLDTLKAAPEQGFSADRFHVHRIEQLLGSSDRRDQAEAGRELRAALIDYARAQHGLTIPASAFPQDWGLKPEPYDAAASLDQALQAGDLKGWLAAQPSPLPAYQQLQKAYVADLKIQAAGGWPSVTAFKLAPGAQGPHVAALRQRLAAEDPQLSGPVAAPADAGLIAALQRFQTAYGLPATGKLDAATVAALDVPAQGRAAQIRANMERLRWLPRQTPPTRIDVNTAAAEMDYYQDGRLVTHMLAASGKPGDDETPMLRSQIKSIVLNPPWNVPDNIAQDELVPKGPEYLQAKGFVWKDGRLVQQPGPDAALGVVKFDFPNPYAVYLHDTPAKAAFQQSQRAVSHGCVRLAQAVDLAKTILSQQPGWSAARVDETLAARDTVRVSLQRPIPVRLVYLTAYPAGDRIAFRPDIYGWDAQLLQMLDHPPAPKQPGKKT